MFVIRKRRLPERAAQFLIIVPENVNYKENLDKIEPKGCISGADGSAPDEPPVLRRVIVGGEAVVGVHPVGGRASVREIAPQGQLRVIQLGGVVGRCCHRHDAAGPEEEQRKWKKRKGLFVLHRARTPIIRKLIFYIPDRKSGEIWMER